MRSGDRILRGRQQGIVALVAVLALSSGTATAATLDSLPTAPERYVVEQWTTRDGLPQNSVTDILQDREGYLWITTFGGLARYDGRTFRIFDMDSEAGLDVARFMSIFEDASGALWLGGERGRVLRFEEGHFEDVDVPVGVGGSPIIGFAQQADGTVWAATKAGPVRWHDGEPTVVELPAGAQDREVRSILVDAEDRVWAGIVGGPVCISGDCPTAPPLVEGLGAAHALARHLEFGLLSLSREGLAAGIVPGEGWLAEVKDAGWAGGVFHEPRTGRIWFTAYDSVYVGKPGAFERVELSTGKYHIRALLLDRAGAVWVGTDGGGLLQIRDRHVQVHGEAAGLASPSVRTVLPDPEGGLWVAAGCNVLHRLNGDAFETHPLPSEAGCIGPMAWGEDGALWYAGGPRLYRRDLAGDTLVATLESDVLALHPSPSGWWVGTGGAGLLHLTGGVASAVPGAEPLSAGSVRVIARAPNGALWLGTDAGVAILMDGSLRRLGGEEGLGAGAVRAIHIDPDGVAWVGTYGGGLTRIDEAKVDRFGRSEGLCDHVVSAIIPGDDGALWMNGNRGVFRVQRVSIEGFLAGDRSRIGCRLFESGEGNGGVQPAGARGPDGRLYFATIAGVAEVDPPRIAAASAPPRMTIEEAQVDGRILADGAQVGPGRGDLRVETAVLSLAPGALHIEHRLVGGDDGWLSDGAATSVRYMGLPPGSYRLDVRARNDMGDVGEIASLGFVLDPVLHQRIWFRWALALFLFGVVSGAWSLRSGSLRRHAAELQAEIDARKRLMDQLRQAQRVEVMGHLAGGVAHDFNNLLTAAGGGASLLRADLAGTEHEELVEEIQTAIERGADLAQRLLQFARGGEPRPVPLVLTAVVDELVPILRRVVPSRISILLEAATPGLRAQLDRVELEQAVMNLVVNARDAISDKGTIRMRIEARQIGIGEARARSVDEGGYVVLIVRDDGEGMDKELQGRVFAPFFTTKKEGVGTGLGLATVQRVVGQAGGFVLLESEVGVGTRFELWFPAL